MQIVQLKYFTTHGKWFTCAFIAVKVTRCTFLSFLANAGKNTVKVSSEGGFVGVVAGYAINSKISGVKIIGGKINGENAAAVVGKAVDSEIENISVSDTSVTAEKYAGIVAAISKNSTMKEIKVGRT